MALMVPKSPLPKAVLRECLVKRPKGSEGFVVGSYEFALGLVKSTSFYRISPSHALRRASSFKVRGPYPMSNFLQKIPCLLIR